MLMEKMIAEPQLNTGAAVFKGATDTDIMTYFKQLAELENMPSFKVIPGKGTVHPVKFTGECSAGSTLTLRCFSTSAQQNGVKSTIDLIILSKKGGRRVERKTIKDINSISSCVIETSYGLSIGAIWQHISVECAGLPDNYLLRKEVFFSLLTQLLNENKIKLATNGIFLSGTIAQQTKALQAAWPPYPCEDENNDLDEYGMWFLVKAPAGVVWLTPDGKELWT
ncbi:MAG: hypothetical protein XXXJIFNMEKO3_02130 [Candidatus Erwinia impunctatus]|nr:hypothetical protein XXXJIFNMEKO_02130 [Culicoides impunctatus]